MITATETKASMDTTMSNANDDILCVMSKNSLEWNKYDKIFQWFDHRNNPETWKKQVTAVSAYLLPRTISHQGNQSRKRPNPKKHGLKSY